MADTHDVLAAIAALERRYDGPIPEPVRDIVRCGSAEAVLLAEATSQAAFFAALIRGQIEAIRQARKDGAISGALIDDLKLYRRQEFWWRGEAERLRAIVAVKRSAADVP